MTRNFKVGTSIVLILALAIVLLALLSKEARGQVSIIKAPLGGYGAITTCDQNNKVIVVVNNTVSAEDYPEVILHEFTHVEEMKVYPGGCQAMLNRYRSDIQFRFEVEARAYCKGYEHLVQNGMPKENILKLAVYVQKIYAQGNTVAEVLEALPCGKGVVITPNASMPP